MTCRQKGLSCKIDGYHQAFLSWHRMDSEILKEQEIHGHIVRLLAIDQDWSKRHLKQPYNVRIELQGRIETPIWVT